jgi:lactoylglutathione lyase
MNSVRITSILAIVIVTFSACSGSDKPPEATLQGLRTAVYGVAVINAAKNWYSEALGIEPYFAEDFCVGFNVGGYELALDPNRPVAQPEGSGVMVYWGVDDVEEELNRLLSLGARSHTPFQDGGGDIKIGSVLDPYGNAIGLIFNPQFETFD